VFGYFVEKGEEKMKHLLGLTLAVASLGVFGMSTEAKASDLSRDRNVVVTANATPQEWGWQRDRYGRRIYDGRYYNRRPRAYTRTRVVRYGRRLVRETYLVRAFPNGRVDTRLISRVVIG
jgi:hypothetical protein